MPAVQPMHLLWLLAAIAVLAVVCTFVGAAVARRNKRRARDLRPRLLLWLDSGCDSAAMASRRQ